MKKRIGKVDIGYDVSKSVERVSEIPFDILEALAHAYSLSNAEDGN
jgi:hypothetical protein